MNPIRFHSMERNQWFNSIWGMVKRRIVGFSEIFAFLSIAGISAGLLAEYHFLFDMCTHFRVQATVCLLLCGTFLVVFARKKWFGLLSLAVGLGLAATIAPWFIGTSPPRNHRPDLRLFSFNVLTSNPSKEAVGEYILRENADVVILYEVNRQWLMALEWKLSPVYPHDISRTREDNFGIAAFSKKPFASAEIVSFGYDGIPSVDLRLDRPNGKPIRIIGTHPLPPTNREHWNSRNDQLADLSEEIARRKVPTILCGDLNSTPWSPFLKRFMKTSGQLDSAKGYGLEPTWTGFSHFFGLPIDHVFHAPAFKVINRKIGPSLGSDHRGITVDFGFPEI